MSGEALVSFWLAVALVVVTLLGAFGWIVALSLARDWFGGRAALRNLYRRGDAQQARLRELRFLNQRLVAVIRDTTPKATR